MPTHPVRPELVEGLSFVFTRAGREGQGFDKLSPNGIMIPNRVAWSDGLTPSTECAPPNPLAPPRSMV